MAKRDYYYILKVAPLGTTKEIREAYRSLSKEYHPDRNPGKAEKQTELVEAYSTINDTDKRKQYDAQAHFQFRRSSQGRKIDKKTLTRKPKKKEESFFMKLLAPFFGKSSGKKEIYDPKQADVLFTLGTSLCDNESMMEQARSQFQQAVKFDPDHREAAFNHALSSYKLGDFDLARQDFEGYIEKFGADPVVQRMISLLQPDT